MPPYPIGRIPGIRYRGSNPKKKSAFLEEFQQAKAIADFLNKEMERPDASNRRSFNYSDLASELRIPKDRVASILAGIGGSNTIAVWKENRNSGMRNNNA